MHLEAITSLVADLFATHGYDVTQDAALEGRSGTVYGAPVLAEREKETILVERRLADDVIELHLLEEMGRVIADTGASRGLLVHLGPMDHDAAQTASRLGIGHWDRATLASLIGATEVAAAAGLELPALDFAPMAPTERVAANLHELLPPPFQSPPEAAASTVAAAPAETHLGGGLDDGFGLDGLEMFDQPMHGMEAIDTIEPPMTPTQMPLGPATSLPAIPPRIGAQETARAMQSRLFTIGEDARLLMQPIHLLDYECDLLLEGSLAYETAKGRVEVHGTTKIVREVDPELLDPSLVGALPEVPLDERALRVTDGRADERARAAILEAHTRTVEIETHDEDEDFSIIEQKRVAPRPDQVRIQHLGAFLRPLWRLRGPNGEVFVDALTGDVVEEALRTPDPGTIILD